MQDEIEIGLGPIKFRSASILTIKLEIISGNKSEEILNRIRWALSL